MLAALAGLSGSATAQGSRDATFERLLRNPDDPALNVQFAAEAEARGELRQAMAALERAKAARPDDPAIAAEYERVRRKTLPDVTTATIQAGIGYTSNPLQLPKSSTIKRDAIFDLGANIEDERTLGDIRLRTLASVSSQLYRSSSEVNTARLNFASGPVFALDKDLQLHLAPGSSHVWLDGQHLYDEARMTATFSSLFQGVKQSIELRGGYRFGNDSIDYSDSYHFDVAGRFTFSPQLIGNDFLYVQPRGTINRVKDESAAATTPSVLARDFVLLSYNEWGGRLGYFFPILPNNQAYFGAGISAYRRDYDSGVIDAAGNVTDEKRRDFYLEPTAHLIFPRLVADNVDVRIDYRFEDNHSNEKDSEFKNHVVILGLVGNF